MTRTHRPTNTCLKCGAEKGEENGENEKDEA